MTTIRLEIVPVRGVDEHLAELPAGLTVAVTSSPRFGLERTLAYAELLAARRHVVAPHLSAKHIVDRAHLADVVARLDTAGVRDVFVVGGDGHDVAGEFKTGVELIRALAEVGHRFERVGVPAYPEGHPEIDDATLFDALREKQETATYMVTQMCFDAPRIATWLEDARRERVTLPVFIGVAGAIRRTELLQMSARLGVGPSIRYLTKHASLLGRVVSARPYRPDRLVTEIDGCIDATLDLAGYQYFTFNQIQRTLRYVP